MIMMNASCLLFQSTPFSTALRTHGWFAPSCRCVSSLSRRTIGATRTFSIILQKEMISPRVAVSTVVQWQQPLSNNNNDKNKNDDDATTFYYLLIQRGKAPNKGMWSFPGGSLDLGETALQGAMRELKEEVTWHHHHHHHHHPDDDTTTNNNNNNNGSEASSSSLRWQWYEEPFCTSDAIGEGFHYFIAQCFVQVGVATTKKDPNNGDMQTPLPPSVMAADDAADAAWLTKQDIMDSDAANKNMTPGVLRVIERAEQLQKAGLLPTTIITTMDKSKY